MDEDDIRARMTRRRRERVALEKQLWTVRAASDLAWSSVTYLLSRIQSLAVAEAAAAASSRTIEQRELQHQLDIALLARFIQLAGGVEEGLQLYQRPRRSLLVTVH